MKSTTGPKTIKWRATTALAVILSLLGCSSSPDADGPDLALGSVQSAALIGEWTKVSFPSITIAAANLPNGKIVTWASDSRFNFGGGAEQTHTALFDPATLSAQETIVTSSNHDMFCPGSALLPDGRVFVNGGGADVRATSVYDASTAAWSADGPMAQKRWYNTSVTLPDGNVFTLGGNLLGNRVYNGGGELWSRGRGWEALPGAKLDPLVTTNPVNRSEEHPRLFVAPNGKLFVPGPHPNMQWYDWRNGGSVTFAGTRGNDAFSQNDVTVMFDQGKLLKAGGNVNYDRQGALTSPSSKTAYVIDINSDQAMARQVAPMQRGRTYANGVVLPDGKVLVLGGLNNGKAFTDQGAVLVPELFDPVNETWTDVSTMTTPRTYHSVALLMPDGRVFAGGGGQCGPGCTANHFDAEIFSPAYLFQGTRPAITSGPSTAGYAATIAVGTTGPVGRFVWIRMASVTHSINTDQRLLRATATALGNGSFSVSTPANANLAPPGYYMLFALNGEVPSVAKIIRLGNTVPNGPINLALGRPATQSSTYGGRSASIAVDGSTRDLSEAHVSHTNADAQAYWQVDLGASFSLGKVNVWNRVDCCSGRLSNFDVKASLDGTNWTSVIRVPGQGASPTVVDFGGARGRYVRVQLSGTNFLSLAEVEVFSGSLAFGKPATQSSTYQNLAAQTALNGRIIDNSELDVSHTLSQPQAWWQVDLGASHDIGAVDVYTRTDCCSNRLTNFQVRLSPDGTNWTSTIAVPGQAAFPTRVDFQGATGRFVRVQLVGSNFLSLTEVDVFRP